MTKAVVTVIARLKVKPGVEATARALLMAAVSPTLAEEG